jgi:hypothetical protein
MQNGRDVGVAVPPAGPQAVQLLQIRDCVKIAW